jgi:hypothetical protein
LEINQSHLRSRQSGASRAEDSFDQYSGAYNKHDDPFEVRGIGGKKEDYIDNIRAKLDMLE